MFGVFRAYLALCVFASHIIVIPFIGRFAVEGFFVLSGYLMTLIMSETYGYSARGMGSYALNRALRLFPSYWAVLALTILAIYALGEDTSKAYRSTMYLPDTAWGWIQNLTMIFADWNPQNIQPRLSPATWALTVELFFYALIGLGLFRSRALTWIVFSVGVAWQIYIVVTAILDVERMVNLFLEGALPFAVGGLVFHYRYGLARFSPGTIQTYIMFLLGFAALGAMAIWLRANGLGTIGNGLRYVNIALCAGTVAFLAQPGVRIYSKVDQFIGDFSYHIYISHWAVAMVVANTLFDISRPERLPLGLGVFLVSAGICVVLSLALRTWVDTPVERLRSSVKKARTLSPE